MKNITHTWRSRENGGIQNTYLKISISINFCS